MASFSSSYRERSWMYDVFLSFRGEDTRNNFTAHLYMALNRAGFRTFRDSEGLRKGEDISPALIGAIQGSRISIIVFSDNYASSSWCLDELLHILECKETHGQIVLPIFYHVDPSNVRNQRGSFGKAFKKHKAAYEKHKAASEKHEARETREKIGVWRTALRHASHFAGWDIPTDHLTGRSEPEVLREVVEEISKWVNNTCLHVAVYPVGIESRIKDISNSLYVGVDDDVRMVGIWGMGGSGKTSIAKALFNKFYHSFEDKSFLGSVRETAKDSKGKITLQERLLSDILKPTKVEVGDANRGIVVIKERLGSKKALVIVDDVDDVDQLTALAIRHDSFGPGSRIVITTRDRHLLELLKVDTIHLTQEMKDEEALELFSWHAFQNPCPDSGFLELTRRLVAYCGGLPLALEVLGSALFKGSIRHWKSTLKKLEKFPDDKIHKILKISFDALSEDQKEIFLHISCFFVGMDNKYVTQILHGCGHFPDAGIGVLLQRCLVTVSERNKLMMHDLLRDMGREVVRAESPKEPEKRSRLWHQEDVIDVLTEESGTIRIEGLALNLQRSDTKRFRTVAFRKMKRLKLLQLNYVQLDGDYDYLSKQLRWLCWRGFSLSTIGNEFLNEQNLVSIDLRYSKLEQVWEQPKLLEKLKILNLSHSHYLTHTPDFSNLPNLKYLILKDCKSLSEIHKSIGHLRGLVLLNLKDCIMLRDLPKCFYKLKSVGTLVLSGCSRFQNLNDDIGNMTSLTTLLVSGTAISQVPSCLGRLELNYSSLQDLILVKHHFPDVPRYHFPALPRGFTSLNMGSSSVHGLPEHPCFNNCTNVPASENLRTRSNELESDHRTALAIIPSSSKSSRQSILQGWTANGEGDLFFNDCISLSDLSNLKGMRFNHCTSLLLNRDIATSLKELEADHYTNALEIVPNFSKASRQSILQGLTARRDGGICLPGNDFQKRFIYVRKSDQVFFQMPQIIGCNLKALTVRVVCSHYFREDMSPSCNSIFVTNHTKLICFVVRPAYPTEITSHEVIWQGNLSNNQLNLEGGDFVEVEVVTGSGLRVKKTGVSLVWDPKLINESTECEPIPYENLQSDTDNQAGPSHELSDEDRPLKRLKSVCRGSP
ncbi:disease resistance protein RPV1 isoform X2 [Rosa chinensis]|uniref:disease resistance protein RPV1 isoform X2 n=1 Tax=Rosa chinensis TaxID=74649 RepID=UPI001AD8D83F|nr:disease resistance protein RPV1 isoform X2 [Rosa chinensis]